MNLSVLSESLNHNPAMVLAAILGLGGLVTLAVITLGAQAVVQWRIHLESEREMEFKRDLISLGYTPDEVAKIASTPEQKSTCNPRPRARHSRTRRKAMADAISR